MQQQVTKTRAQVSRVFTCMYNTPHTPWQQSLDEHVMFDQL
jgi:hypothetical protein